jgi:3-(3-hydroxy-phenyl)propionate hydroxylase
MADSEGYTEFRKDLGGLRRGASGRLQAGEFEFPVFEFVPPPELRERRVGRHKVVIVGGGLAGLAAAVDLGARGIPCVLLDDNNTVSLGSRSIAQGKRTMEIATRLGIDERMSRKGVRWSRGHTLIQDKLIYSFDIIPHGDEKYAAFLALPQYYMETILADRSAEFPGVELRWSNRVSGVTQGDKTVRLDVETPQGSYAIDADWVIACDGVRSTMRKSLSIPFEGASFIERFVICDVKMGFEFPPQRMFWFDPTFDRSNIALMHQQPDSIWRVDWQLDAGDDPHVECDPEMVKKRLRTMFGPDVPFELQFASVYAFEVRRVKNFRHGRVFFAGDAAHQLSPFGGGRGGNSGIQDIDNLGWKLAHVIRGQAPERLLDSYDAERGPVAEENLRLSRRAAEFINPTGAHSLALRNAVLTLAPRYPFAKVMINTGRLSVAPNLRGSWLMTPDVHDWLTAVTPGNAAIDAPVTGPRGDWFIHYLTGDFQLMVYIDQRKKITPELIAALTACRRDKVPVLPFIVLGEIGTAGDIPVIHDTKGLLRERYDLASGNAYLFRPDQHVCARWRTLNPDLIRRAVRRSLGDA